MVGVNQVIMLALNMVIIASMIGAGGLGYDVLLALRALKVGAAMEAGLAIVRAGDRARPAEPGRRRAGRQATPRDWGAAGGAIICAGCRHPRRHHAPQPLCPGFGEPAESLHRHHRADLEGGDPLDHVQFLRRHRGVPRRLLIHVLKPVKCLPAGASPGSARLILLTLAGYRLGGRRLALLIALLTAALRRLRPLGQGDDDALSLRRLRHHRLRHRPSHRHPLGALARSLDRIVTVGGRHPPDHPRPSSISSPW